jgi:hypothetical protein
MPLNLGDIVLRNFAFIFGITRFQSVIATAGYPETDGLKCPQTAWHIDQKT